MNQPGGWATSTLGYRFQDEGLLQLALTHRSTAGDDNERLEFLGDAILGLVIAEALYVSHPRADEGTLSRLRARLVRRQTLEEVAREIDLGVLLRLGAGESRAGGHRRGSILGNSLEAVFGAVFLDGGWTAARQVILRLLDARLVGLDGDEDLRDPKTRLQELLQGQGNALPAYEVERVTGSAHAQQFDVICRLVTPRLEARGQGSSRRAAEQQAAEQVLRELGAHE